MKTVYHTFYCLLYIEEEGVIEMNKRVERELNAVASEGWEFISMTISDNVCYIVMSKEEENG